jgi:hypothetical protein
VDVRFLVLSVILFVSILQSGCVVAPIRRAVHHAEIKSAEKRGERRGEEKAEARAAAEANAERPVPPPADTFVR